MNTKVCKTKTCGKEYPLTDEFWYKVTGKNGKIYWRGSCKQCASNTDKQWRADNKEKDKYNADSKRVRYAYGITLEEYKAKMATSTVCQICGRAEEIGSASRKLNYDHCHSTGTFRGILCRTCNQSIGQLGDTAADLYKAYMYLKTFENK